MVENRAAEQQKRLEPATTSRVQLTASGRSGVTGERAVRLVVEEHSKEQETVPIQRLPMEETRARVHPPKPGNATVRTALRKTS